MAEKSNRGQHLNFTEWSNDQGSFVQMDRLVAIICFYGTQVKKRNASSWGVVPDYLSNMQQLYNVFLRPMIKDVSQDRLDKEINRIWESIGQQTGNQVSGKIYNALEVLEKDLFQLKQQLNMTFKTKPVNSESARFDALEGL